MGATLLRLLDRGDTLAPSCVNLADFEAGLCQAGWARQRRRVETRTPSLPEPPGPMAPCS
jgi:hypothetical protein